MRQWSVLVVVCVIVLAWACPAHAGEIEKGTVELGTRTFFNFSSYSDDDADLSITNINIAGNVGFFATNVVEIITGLAIIHQGIDPGEGESFSTTDFGLALNLRFNFANESHAVPFVGVGAGIVGHSGDTFDEEMTIIIPSVEAGVRFLVGASASVNLGVAYEHQSNALGVEDVSGNIFLIGVGVSAFVKGGAAE